MPTGRSSTPTSATSTAYASPRAARSCTHVLEHSDDVRVSTLRQYLDALGVSSSWRCSTTRTVGTNPKIASQRPHSPRARRRPRPYRTSATPPTTVGCVFWGPCSECTRAVADRTPEPSIGRRSSRAWCADMPSCAPATTRRKRHSVRSFEAVVSGAYPPWSLRQVVGQVQSCRSSAHLHASRAGRCSRGQWPLSCRVTMRSKNPVKL